MSAPVQIDMCEKQSEVTVADKQEMMQAPGMVSIEGEHEMAEKSKDAADVDLGDLIPINACFCYVQSCYCKMPNCIGCNCNSIILCSKCECTGLKCVKPSENDDGACCIWWKGGCNLTKFKTCIASDTTFFCCDYRCALPPTKEVPSMLTFLGLTCVGGKGCCKNLAQINPEMYGPNRQ